MLEDILKNYGAKAVEPLAVYQDIFRLGEGCLQHYNQEERNLIANPIGYGRNNEAKKGKFRIFFEDTFADTLKELQEMDFAILNGVTYFGRKNLSDCSSKMYCMIFDLDGVTDSSLNNFFSGAFNASVYPIPNYIVLSGHGVHFYYLFEEPISLFPNTKIQLKNLKYALIDRIWNPLTSTIEEPQYQGIFQGFRIIGGKTKIEGVRSRAFKMNEHPFSVEELNDFVPESERVDISKMFKESKITLSEAEKMYPEWYQKVIVEGDKTKGTWLCKRDLYDWWKRQIQEGAVFHHRYFCIMMLAIYGVKSGISFEEVEKDALELIPFMNDINPENPFTKEDVYSALECYDRRYITFPLEDISRLSAIPIQKNKRNGRKQSAHIRYMNYQRAFRVAEGECTNGGRPSKENIVRAWQRNNPGVSKAECIRQTGLSKPTVYKHWR